MHIQAFSIVSFALLPALTTAQTPPSSQISQKQISNAVAGWANDTGKVTNFLNTATSISSKEEYSLAATIALNAEIDELNHKAVLDDALGSMAAVQTANQTLATQGTFQAVVDALRAMVAEGPDTAQQKVTEINNNRCVNVLPNIDAYFAAAGEPNVRAVVPTGCLEVAGAPGATPGAGAGAGTGNQNTPLPPGNEQNPPPPPARGNAPNGTAPGVFPTGNAGTGINNNPTAPGRPSPTAIPEFAPTRPAGPPGPPAGSRAPAASGRPAAPPAGSRAPAASRAAQATRTPARASARRAARRGQ